MISTARLRSRLASLALAALLLGTFAGSRLLAAPQAQPARATCVFTNPAYAGPCAVTVDVPKDGTPRKACEAVLACLNDTRCLKTYCSATTVRGGWQLREVK
jgi:hypothetical protein